MKLLSLAFFTLFLSFNVSLAQKSVFKNERLEILQLSEHTFQHITYLETDSFGKVPCNGIVVVNEGKAIVVDSPAEEGDAEILLDWVQEQMDLEVSGVIATHFHEDCVGGLEAFHRQKIPSYGSRLTISLADENGFPTPKLGFDRLLSLKLGSLEVRTQFFGKGHTEDNTVCFVEKDQVLFGGCLIKEMGAGKGNLADADTLSWSKTALQIKENFPELKVVVPGHGKAGTKELLEYTAKLFH
ncbi:subclass B1 metallo-beta-lactamase [Algoriphagus hitonicola]|uniref:beta-lactamase n=1 Tax=Algoriphagus hitonicola TaxID=435880 RepID=A0A1I2T9T7_9BACT|nr:subclass B1 metallo-beta-lactamase [Algoriphagus hitonicola]SFG61530.1 metallo-beta-lactamase class B [Algoriphagus hitonicola]